jgi:hypothetical protein
MRRKISWSGEPEEFTAIVRRAVGSSLAGWGRVLRVTMHLARVNFALKVVQFLDGQAAEKLDPALNLKCRLQEVFVLLLVRAFEGRRVIDAPVSADRDAWKSRTPLAGIVGESDDEIKILVGELLPGNCHRAGGVDLEILAKNFQDERVHVAGSFPSAINFKAIASHRPKQKLGEDAALRVAGA